MNTQPLADSRWTGTPLTTGHLERMTPDEARLYGYLAWCAATRRRVSLITLGSLRTANGAPMGVPAARRAAENLHDQGLLMLPGWATASDTTPLPVLVSAMPPRTASTTRLHPRSRTAGVQVGAGFIAHKSLPAELVQKLKDLYRRSLQLNKPGNGERDAEWLDAMAEVTELRAAAFYEWSTLESAPAIRREARRLEEAANNVRAQAAAKRAKQARTNPS